MLIYRKDETVAEMLTGLNCSGLFKFLVTLHFLPWKSDQCAHSKCPENPEVISFETDLLKCASLFLYSLKK